MKGLHDHCEGISKPTVPQAQGNMEIFSRILLSPQSTSSTNHQPCTGTREVLLRAMEGHGFTATQIVLKWKVMRSQVPLINVFSLAQCKSNSVDSSAGIYGLDQYWASIPSSNPFSVKTQCGDSSASLHAELQVQFLTLSP